jgi:hypothetical protein
VQFGIQGVGKPVGKVDAKGGQIRQLLPFADVCVKKKCLQQVQAN